MMKKRATCQISLLMMIRMTKCERPKSNLRSTRVGWEQRKFTLKMTTLQTWRLHIMRSNMKRGEHIRLQRRKINAS